MVESNIAAKRLFWLSAWIILCLFFLWEDCVMTWDLHMRGNVERNLHCGEEGVSSSASSTTMQLFLQRQKNPTVPCPRCRGKLQWTRRILHPLTGRMMKDVDAKRCTSNTSKQSQSELVEILWPIERSSHILVVKNSRAVQSVSPFLGLLVIWIDEPK